MHSLQALARQVMTQLELRLRVSDLAMQIQMRQQMEIALRTAHAEAEDLYNNAPCGYHMRDADGVFIRMNNTEMQWLGYKKQEVIGRLTLNDILAPQSLENAKRRFAEIRDIRKISDLEAEFVRRDGTTFPVLLNVQAVSTREAISLARALRSLIIRRVPKRNKPCAIVKRAFKCL